VPIGPGVDRPSEVLKKAHRPSAAPLKLLCVASLVRRKGQDILIRALHKVAPRPVRCTLVGLLDRDAAFATEIRQLLDALDLSGQVEITGPLDEAALELRWQDADVLVLPS